MTPCGAEPLPRGMWRAPPVFRSRMPRAPICWAEYQTLPSGAGATSWGEAFLGGRETWRSGAWSCARPGKGEAVRRAANSAQVRQTVMTASPNSMEIQFPVPERTSPFRRGAHLRASRAPPSVYNDVCRLRVAVVHSPARAFARLLAGPTQLAIERGGVALQDHLRDLPDRGALVHKSATQRDLLRC